MAGDVARLGSAAPSRPAPGTPPARVRLSAAVMTHPSRLAEAERLLAALADLEPAMVIDPDPAGPPSSLRTARHAWAAVAPDATHHLVLQDDAWPAAGFARQARDAAARRPGHAISLFTHWGSRTSFAVRLAALIGHGWAEVIDGYTPTVGLILPAAAARAFAGLGEARTAKDDVEMRGFLLRRAIPSCVIVPNLVEHLGTDSLVGNDRLGPRRSACPPAEGLRPYGPGPDRVAVSYFNQELAIAGCVVPSAAAQGFTHAPLSRLFAAHGLAETEVAVMAKAELSDPRWAPIAVSSRVLLGYWLTAFALGLQGGRAAVISPLARHALDTMADGVLEPFSRGRLGEFRPAARELALAAVRAGSETSAIRAGDR
ncbi:hypothetical protein KDL01_22540 [Actinospica durhamensis]|uniref:Glycosyltransferase n=1 Tax=Actinospica durhamensis TaxID=1508375 RepID=A0A941EQG7_9ACTN|nr:hypothetical protein [Actinospica durhamensis]MBR7836072.1 hypothetical protein [Actinospica durhamensis]